MGALVSGPYCKLHRLTAGVDLVAGVYVYASECPLVSVTPAYCLLDLVAGVFVCLLVSVTFSQLHWHIAVDLVTGVFVCVLVSVPFSQLHGLTAGRLGQ